MTTFHHWVLRADHPRMQIVAHAQNGSEYPMQVTSKTTVRALKSYLYKHAGKFLSQSSYYSAEQLEILFWSFFPFSKASSTILTSILSLRQSTQNVFELRGTFCPVNHVSFTRNDFAEHFMSDEKESLWNFFTRHFAEFSLAGQFVWREFTPLPISVDFAYSVTMLGIYVCLR